MQRKMPYICRIMPAGKYWLGDPCYSADKDRDPNNRQNDPWLNKWCNLGDADRDQEIDGFKVAMYSTYHGDGAYPCWISGHPTVKSFDFGVDSGTIGLVPLELGHSKAEMEKHYHDSPSIIIHMAEKFTFERDSSGVFRVSGKQANGEYLRIEIETNPPHDDEEEYY